MNAAVTGPVVCEQFSDFWVTRAPIEYRDDDGRRVVVPEGFVHDFASIPRGLWNLFPPTDKCYSAAGIVHDWLYHSWITDRATADDVLYHAARALGTGRVRAWLIWSAVRVGGGGAYATGPERQAALRRQYEALLERSA